ncbi:MAG: lipid-transfer protein [Candidatus Velthaea sp.]
MRWQGKGKIAFAGVGFSAIERNSDKPLGAFAEAAITDALADCGLTPDKIDGLATYPEAPYIGAPHREGEDMIGPEYVIANCKVGDVRWYADLNGGMVTAAVVEAALALLSGACTYALVWRAMHHPKGTYGRRQVDVATGDSQFTEPFGCPSPIQWHALAYRRYMERYGATREQMAEFVLNSRHNANLNTNAYFHDKPLAFDEYMKARMISDPLCLLDCDIPVQACVALVMTTAERARDLKQRPAYLAGFALNAVKRAPIINYTLVDYFETGRATCRQLWASTGLQSADMSAAMLYDGFAPSTMYWLESAGFCGRGEAFSFVQDGRIALGGQLPVNTFGGSLSQGRLHGMGHAAEAVLQTTDRAGERQVPDAHAVCVFSGSPMYRGSGIVVTRDP